MPATHLKTPAAALTLGVPYTQLMSLVRYRKVQPPAKDSSGHYIWSEEDLEAVRRVLGRADGPLQEAVHVR
jgi:hypothetical protein